MIRTTAFAALLLSAGLVQASDLPEYKLVIKNHRFEPAELSVPSGQKIKLLVENQDATAEEFESYELNREKVVAANATISVFIGPLTPGRYPYFGDFNQATAKGTIVAK